jgi:hypothetical protein
MKSPGDKSITEIPATHLRLSDSFKAKNSSLLYLMTGKVIYGNQCTF